MEFIFKKISASGYGVSMWLKVKEFRDAIQSMIDNNVTISNTTVWPVMIEILNRNPNRADIDGVPAAILYNAYKEVRRGSYKEMDDFVGRFGKLYEQVMALRKNEDYVVNPIQMDRFLDLVQFFIRKSEDASESSVNPRGFAPKECHGGVTATFIVFDLGGSEEVQEFCKVLKHCSAVSIDAVDDYKVCISCTVPNVFVHK